MILLQLRANFGKLHGTLTLHEGLNELCLPNEAGKSTWSAFLLAMLYGIDTRERATRENQNLPAKERYRPWDGSSMASACAARRAESCACSSSRRACSRGSRPVR